MNKIVSKKIVKKCTFMCIIFNLLLVGLVVLTNYITYIDNQLDLGLMIFLYIITSLLVIFFLIWYIHFKNFYIQLNEYSFEVRVMFKKRTFAYHKCMVLESKYKNYYKILTDTGYYFLVNKYLDDKMSDDEGRLEKFITRIKDGKSYL